MFYYYNVKYYNPVFNELINEIDIQNKIEYHNEKFQIKKNINLENIFFKYDENSISTIKNLNLEIKFNSSVGIFGKSGSGKTTFLDILSGLVVPNSGSLFVDDQIINDNFLIEMCSPLPTFI